MFPEHKECEFSKTFFVLAWQMLRAERYVECHVQTIIVTGVFLKKNACFYAQAWTFLTGVFLKKNACFYAQGWTFLFKE